MTHTVCITGASSGIGKACAQVFALHGYDVILVAQNRDRLEAAAKDIAARYGVRAETIVQDLTAPDAAQAVLGQCRALGAVVDVLINDAGFGDHAAFVDSSWQKQKKMVDLNILALMQMCFVFAREMIENGGGSILNVASLAGAVPSGPYMAVYYASKAFVLSFSESLHTELRPLGVTVGALCPGPVSTNFNRAAGLAHGFKGLRPQTPQDVAKDAYRAVVKKKAVTFTGAASLLAFGARFVPRAVAAKLAAWVNGKPEPAKAAQQTDADMVNGLPTHSLLEAK